MATRTRRFPTLGSLGVGTNRPLFDGSFFGNLGAFRELAFAAPFLLGACRSSRPRGGQNHKKSVENQLNDGSLLCQEITNNKIPIESINNAIFYFYLQGYINKEGPHLLNV